MNMTNNTALFNMEQKIPPYQRGLGGCLQKSRQSSVVSRQSLDLKIPPYQRGLGGCLQISCHSSETNIPPYQRGLGGYLQKSRQSPVVSCQSLELKIQNSKLKTFFPGLFHKSDKIIHILFFLLLIWLLSSCDQIYPPYTKNSSPDTSHIDTSKVVRKILLEDYTGYKCVNCPTADDIATGLETTYKGRLVILDVHAGFFAKPDGSGNYTYDFRTSAGNELDNFFGISDIGNPNGLINRVGYLPTNPSNAVIKPGNWESTIQSLLPTSPKMSIKLAADYDSVTRNISVKVDIKYLTDGTSHDNLCVYIKEDSIIQYQKDNRKTPPDIPNYVHMHVLRGSMNGTWGDQLSTGDIPSGTTFSKQYQYQIPPTSDWKPKNLKIIAFIHDFQNTYEVWQVEETPLNIK